MTRTTERLLSPKPSAVASARVTISHPQLRDLITCPQERGMVNYVQRKSILEHDITDPESTARPICNLDFVPNTLASYALPDSDSYLLAAGGQDCELHLSMHSRVYDFSLPSPSGPSTSAGSIVRRSVSPSRRSPDRSRTLGESFSRPPRTRQNWSQAQRLPGSINNSVAFTVAGTSSVEPRLVVSNNDWVVTFYDISVREGYAFNHPGGKGKGLVTERWQSCGSLVLDVAINHSSVSPDGRTLLSVGDSSKVYLHDISASSNVTFTSTSTLSLPASSGGPYYIRNGGSAFTPAIPAAFSTAWSATGSKFAVGGQDGVVSVWDVRSSRPLRVLETERRVWARETEGGDGNGGASGWLREDPWYHQYGNAPGWGVRAVKFGSSASGREVLAFTEHTSKLHIIDACSFETEEVVRVPTPRQSPSRASRTRSASPARRAAGSVTASHNAAAAAVLPDQMARVLQMLDFPPSQIAELSGEDQVVFRELRRIALRAGLHQLDQENPVSELGILSSEHGPLYDLDSDMGSDTDTDDMELSHSAPQPSVPAPAFLRSASPALSDPGAAAGWYLSPRSTPGVPARRKSGPMDPAEQRGRAWEADYDYDPDADLAGLCFDPTGAWLYAASTHGVSEWVVRGAVKRWWGGPEWI